MTLIHRLQPHAGKLVTFFCLITFLLFYHRHNIPSLKPYPVKNGPVGVFGFLGPTKGQKHPIEILVDDARRKYTHMVESQSKSLEEAIANYRKRYRREPPPGFDDWYQVAVRLNAIVIDDYDSVMTMFEPYWGMSARELRARVREVLDSGFPGDKLVGIRVKDHEIETVHGGSVDLSMQLCFKERPLRER